MKFYCLLVFIFLLSVDAQRRSVNSELLSENEPQPKSARRGRARFTASESSQTEDLPKRSDSLSRRLVSRRRPETHTETIPPRKTYEVDEVVDEVPIETFRRTSKTKVLTETKYEAQNVPPSNTLFQPSTTENFDDVIKSIGGDIFDTTVPSVPSSSTFPSSLEPQSSEITSGEYTKIDNEISRVSETTTPLTTRTTKRSNGRSRNNGVTAAPTVASRVRTRTRPTRRPEEQNSVSPSSRATFNRGSRRRQETVNTETRTNVEQPARSRSSEARTRAPPVVPAETVEPRGRHIEPRSRGPSVIATAETVESPRFRKDRRIGTAARKVEEPKPTERGTVDLPPARRFNSRKNVETTTTTIRSRSRFRSRDIPPVIDEQKLEVLPLFERESKTVRPVRKFVSRRRNLNSAEEVETSATENDIKVVPQPPKQSVVVETRTESSIKRRKPTGRLASRTTKPTIPSTRQTVRTNKPTVQTKKPTFKTNKPTVQTTRATTSKPKVHTSKPIIKESVISEITEVTSKRTLTRSKSGRSKVELPKTVGRGSKKLEANLPAPKKSKSSLTSSEEDIEESDNYPEPFKALIQAKKHKKESRSPQHLTTASPAVTKSTEKVVISTPSTTTQVISSEANRQLEDFENELKPSKSVRPTPGRRFSQSTEKTQRPTRKSKFSRSTTTLAPLPTPEHRFHAKFNNEPEVTSSNPVKSSRSFSPKPPRGLYSSRKTKESFTKNKSTTAQIPILKKSNRYSSRYRNDASSRGAIRTSTNAPAYLPTIPTITPPTTSVKSSVAYQDKDLGVEVISFDDPVNTVPSANLVSGEYLASSTENHLSSPLVSASQTKTTEKPVSIIERIINSITAISTTEVPDLTRQTTSPQENLTKESAILKLATKKSTKLDKTQTTQKIPTVTVTSEKPTTIIERILTSLSAIQADNTTDIKHFKSKQVGTNFNTISFPSTTPITRVTKSTLTAPISTSVNPLYILDEISNDQILQKRTIEKLLALLNTLTTPSPHPTPLVVVTPKTTSYLLGSSTANTANTPATTTTTTTEPTTTTTTTETSTIQQLFTSPTPNVSLSSRVQLPAVKYTTTPTYTTLTTQAPTPVPPMSTVSVGEAVTTNSVPTSTLQSSTQAQTEVITANPVSTTTSQTPTLTSTQIPTTTGSNDFSNEIGALPLFVNAGVSSLSPLSRTQSTDSGSGSGVDSTTTSSFDFSTPFGSTLSPTEFGTDTETNFVFPSTIPAVVNFEVSPGSVSVFSANDISNAITPNDILSSTVAISGKANFPEESTTQSTPLTQTTTSVSNPDSTTTTQPSVTLASRVAGSNSTENSLSSISTVPSTVTTDSGTMTPTGTLSSVTPAGTTVTTSMPTTTDAAGSTTLASGTAATTTLASSIDSNSDNNTTQDISSNIIDTTDSSVKSNTSTVSPSTNTTSKASGRSGRLLSVVQDPVQNSLETSTTRSKDYFIFAVLNNNTVLRKRPSRFPNRETPFLIVGVYPNNTIVRKFPNGTLVPMEPTIRVSGFDTRENPPPLPEITSNQVTPDQGSQPENKNLQTVDQNTVPPFEANPLSISSVNNATSTTGSTSSSTVPTVQANPLSISSPSSTTTESSTSTSTSSSSTTAPANSTTPSTATSSTAPTATLPTLTEILNGRTVKAFNSIINISDLSKVQTLDVDPKNNTVSTTLPPPSTTISNKILDDPVRSTTISVPTTYQQPTTTTTVPPKRTTTSVPSTTTFIPTTTFAPTTTIPPSTVASFIRSRVTTVLPLSQPATTTFRTTTNFPSTTFLPQFLNSIISTLRPRRVTTTEAPFTIVTPVSNRIQSTVSPRVEINTPGDLVSASSTRRTIRTTAEPPTSTILTTLPVSTTTRNTRRRGTVPTTTMPPPTTTILATTTLPASTVARNARRSTTSTEPTTTTNATKRFRQLTDQQKKDLQTLAQLEMEQAAILKQLAFLTNLNFANTKPTTEKDDLAKRVIALAVERDKNREKTTTFAPEPEGNLQAKKISATNPQNIEDLLKQLNIATPSTITSEYGKSDDAIIAALLKEQGIGPTTPKVLEDVYSLTTTTTRRPKTTTRRPGPLMQSLNWLLNVLAPPTTKRPKPKSKPKPKPKPKPKTPDSEELLTHQPTHLTPVVTPAPRQNIVSSLSQQDIQKLIKQLETIQKDPNSSKELDFSSIKSLQSLINPEDGVKVTSSGTTGTTTRETTPLTTSKRKAKSRVVKSTTAIPLSVSNGIDDEEFVTTTARPRVTLPPVRLRPVPGIEEDGTMVRGQLINAAVNVTRAISSFLGTALQDAAQQFTRLFANGSSNLRHYLSSSSVLSNVSNVSAAS